MARFYVNPLILKAMSENEEREYAKMLEMAEEIESIRNNLAFFIASQQRIRHRLGMVVDDSKSYGKTLKRMSSTTSNVAALYITTEQKIYANAGGQGNLAGASWASQYLEEKSKHKGIGDIFKDILEGSFLLSFIKEFGFPGKIANGILKALTGSYVTDEGAASWLDILKDITGVAGGIASFIGKETHDLKNLFGLTFENKSFGELFESELKKFAFVGADEAKDLTGAQVTAKNTATICKWAGTVLTAITEGFENFDDNKDSADKYRWLKETIGETAFNVLEDAAISAGVGAAVGSVFPGIGTAAGAVVSFTGTIIVKWGFNKGFEALTGQKIDEFVSDVFIDSIEENGANLINTVGNAVGTTFDNIGRAAKASGKALSSWWNNLSGWGKQAYI